MGNTTFSTRIFTRSWAAPFTNRFNGTDPVTRSVRRCLFIVGAVWFLLMSAAACADEEDQAALARYVPHGPNRFDLSYTHIDVIDADLDLFIFGYTRALRSNMRLGVTGGVTRFHAPADPAAGRDENMDEFGFSDTLISFQYDPTARLTASPWIPNTVGINASVLAPTADADKGLGGDFWLGSVGGGWLVDFFSHLWLVPAIGYESTFAEGDAAVPTHGVYVSCDITWVFPFGAWIGYSPSIGREFETDEWVDGHTLTIGKLWLAGFGLSLELGRNEHISRIPASDDRNWLANFYYQF